MNNIENKLQKIEQLTMNKITNSPMDYITTQNNAFKQPVAQYDIRGNLIRTYESVKETEKSGYDSASVSKCIHNKLKLHDRSIFIKIKHNQKPLNKIDPTPYILRKNSNIGLNNLIVTDISTTKQNETPNMEVKLKKSGIGMFNKKGMLIDIFTTEAQIVNMFGHSSGVYDHLYGRIKTKSKINKGYKNKFFFRKLDKNKSYNVGQKYNLNDFPQAQPKKLNYKNPKSSIKKNTKSSIKNDTLEEKKSILQRLVGYIFGR